MSTETLPKVGPAAKAAAAVDLPLSDITVLDLTHILAGPALTQALGDVGARIIKIEKPVYGDATRSAPPLVGPFGALFAAVNRNKESVALDFGNPRGKQVLLDLARKCDVVVHNFRPGVMKKLGLDFAAFQAVNPRIIMCELSGFGQNTKMARRPAFDPIIQAIAGVTASTGSAASGPMSAGVPVADLVTPLQAQIAILVALRHRDRTGEGQCLDISMYDALISLQGPALTMYSVTGETPSRSGDPRSGPSPVGLAKTKDGYISYGATSNRFWRNLCAALDHPEWIDDPRFKSPTNRSDNRVELRALINAVMIEQPSSYWAPRLEAQDVPYGELAEFKDLIGSEVMRERDLLHHVPSPAGPDRGQIVLAKSPIRYSSLPTAPFGWLPGLGEHTDSVLKDMLGLDDEALTSLVGEHVIGRA